MKTLMNAWIMLFLVVLLTACSQKDTLSVTKSIPQALIADCGGVILEGNKVRDVIIGYKKQKKLLADCNAKLEAIREIQSKKN